MALVNIKQKYSMCGVCRLLLETTCGTVAVQANVAF